MEKAVYSLIPLDRFKSIKGDSKRFFQRGFQGTPPKTLMDFAPFFRREIVWFWATPLMKVQKEFHCELLKSAWILLDVFRHMSERVL